MARSIQKGSVLIVSLLLLLIITIVGIAGISNSMLGERVAGNQRQVSLALMAAESGLVEAKKWLDDNRILWGKTEDSLELLNSLASSTGDASWEITSLVYKSGIDNVADITSCGKVADTGAERCVSFSYIQAKGAAKLAALSLIGKAINFIYNDTGNIEFNGNGGLAIALNDDTNAANLVAIKTKFDELQAKVDSLGIDSLNGDERKFYQRFKGGIEKVDFGDPFGDPVTLNNFVESVKNDYCGCRTTVSYCKDKVYTAKVDCSSVGFYTNDKSFDIGVAASKNKAAIPKLVYIEPEIPGGTLTINLSGSTVGAGIFVVNGNVIFSGTPSYEGLLLVVGDSFRVRGGGNGGVTGSLVVTNLDKNSDDESVFGDVTVELTGTGNSDYHYNEALLKVFHGKLLSGDTQDLWKVDINENDEAAKVGTIFGWKEII